MDESLRMQCDEDCRTAGFGKTERPVGWEGDGELIMMRLVRHCEGKPAATDRPHLPSLSHSFTLDRITADDLLQLRDTVLEAVARVVEPDKVEQIALAIEKRTHCNKLASVMSFAAAEVFVFGVKDVIQHQIEDNDMLLAISDEIDRVIVQQNSR
jgi:hypothetical protein